MFKLIKLCSLIIYISVFKTPYFSYDFRKILLVLNIVYIERYVCSIVHNKNYDINLHWIYILTIFGNIIVIIVFILHCATALFAGNNSKR